MKPHRILIAGLNYSPEEIGIAPYTAGLAQWLAKQGHRASVVAGQPYYPAWKPLPGYPSGWQTDNENGVEIVRCPHYVPANPTAIKRLLHHVSFALASLPPLMRRTLKRPDIVIAIVPSLIGATIALAVARIARTKLWVHVQDLEIDAAVATRLIRQDGWLFRLGTQLEKMLLGQADRVTTISPQMVRRLAEKGLPEARIAELRNWANHYDAIERADGEALRREWNLENRYIALYSGNIANKQGLEIVIEAARLLGDRSDIAFVICGEGPNRRSLEMQAKGLKNVRFEPLQPSARLGELLRMADCHILPQLADAADLVLPSKLANMLASGRPVVATAAAGTGIAREIRNCGIRIPPGDPAALAAAVRHLASKPAQARQLGDAAAKRAQAYWQRDAVLQQADGIVQKLTGAG